MSELDWKWPPEMQAEYDAWLAQREAEGCICLTCIAARRKRMRLSLANRKGDPRP